MEETKLLSPDEMRALSKKGERDYKESVLNGPTLKNIITNIEEAALKGYTGWYKTLNKEDDIREFSVIRDYLNGLGYYCEIEIEKKQGVIGPYNIQKFVVDWRTSKEEG